MNYIRLYEAMNAQELAMIKIAFNNEQVVYRVLFENSLQIADAAALGNSGAIIEVLEEDYSQAKETLIDLDINLYYDQEADQFAFIQTLDAQTKKLPLIGQLNLGYRFLLIALVVVFLLALLLFLTISYL